MRLRVRLDKVTDGASLVSFLHRQDDPHLLTLERIVHASDEVFYTDAPTRHNYHVHPSGQNQEELLQCHAKHSRNGTGHGPRRKGTSIERKSDNTIETIHYPKGQECLVSKLADARTR